MIRQFIVLFLSISIVHANWSNSFDEQYHVFGSKVCDKHYYSAFTSDGINYRLDRDGQYIFEDEGRRSIKNRVNGPARTFKECTSMCQDNSKCVAFAYRHKDSLCQFMGHCKMTHTVDSNFRYFSKKTFGCRNLDRVNGQTCKGMHIHSGSHTLVEECLEKATEYGAQSFSVDGNMNCRIWDKCNGTRFDDLTSLYHLK